MHGIWVMVCLMLLPWVHDCEAVWCYNCSSSSKDNERCPGILYHPDTPYYVPGRLVQCEAPVSDLPSYVTKEEAPPQFYSIITKPIKFNVKSIDEVKLTLSNGPLRELPKHEIIIGTENLISHIVTTNRDEQIKSTATHRLPMGIVDGGHFDSFRVIWTAGKVRVMREGQRPFMEWNDPNPFTVAYYGIKTGPYSTGTWKVEGSHEAIKTPDDAEYNTEYFYPLRTTAQSVCFKVIADRNAYLALTQENGKSEPMYEIIIGGWNNTMSSIKEVRAYIGKNTSDTFGVIKRGKFDTFTITYDGTMIKVIEGTETDEPIMTWKDVEPLEIENYGLRTCNGSTGRWKIRGRPDVITPNSPIYKNFAKFSKSLTFRLSAFNDAGIVLTKRPESSVPIYEIILGTEKNTKSFILETRVREKRLTEKNHPEHSMLKRGKFNKFWLSWANGLVAVYRKDVLEPIVQWQDPNYNSPNYGFRVSHYGLATNGSKGWWKIADADIRTNENGTLKFYKTNRTQLHFALCAEMDARIVLTSNASETRPMYEIILGEQNNTKTSIQYTFFNDSIVYVNKHKKIPFIEGGKFEWFKINFWESSEIIVYRGNAFNEAWEQVMYYKDPDPRWINYVAFRTLDCVGRWVFPGLRALTTFGRSSASLRCNVALMELLVNFDAPAPYSYTLLQSDLLGDKEILTNSTYDFIYVSHYEITFKVSAAKNARIILTGDRVRLDPKYEIVLGGWSNTKSAIRIDRTSFSRIDQHQMRHMKLTGSYGEFSLCDYPIHQINMFHTGRRYGYEFKYYDSDYSSKLPVEYYGIRSEKSASRWKITHTAYPPKATDYETSHQVNRSKHTGTWARVRDRCLVVNFCANKSATLTFSNKNHSRVFQYDVHMIDASTEDMESWVFQVNKTYWTSLRNASLTKGILSVSNYTNFTIDFTHTPVVAKDENKKILVQIDDPDRMNFTHIGLLTKDSPGWWILNDGVSEKDCGSEITTTGVKDRFIVFKISGKIINFSVKTDSDAIVALAVKHIADKWDLVPSIQFGFGVRYNKYTIVQRNIFLNEYKSKETFYHLTMFHAPPDLSNCGFNKITISYSANHLQVVYGIWNYKLYNYKTKYYNIHYYRVTSAPGKSSRWILADGTKTGTVAYPDKTNFSATTNPMVLYAEGLGDFIIDFADKMNVTTWISVWLAQDADVYPKDWNFYPWSTIENASQEYREVASSKFHLNGLDDSNDLAYYDHYSLSWAKGFIELVQKDRDPLMQYTDPSPLPIIYYGITTNMDDSQLAIGGKTFKIKKDTYELKHVNTSTKLDFQIQNKDIKKTTIKIVLCAKTIKPLDPMYEIVIPPRKDAQAYVRRLSSHRITVGAASTPNLLTCKMDEFSEYDEMTLSWTEDTITLKDADGKPFIGVKDTEDKINATMYGVTSNLPASWVIEDEDKNVETDVNQYQFLKLKDNQQGNLKLKVMTKSSIRVALLAGLHLTDTMHEIIVGAQLNKFSYINKRYTRGNAVANYTRKNMLIGVGNDRYCEFDDFWVDWLDGVIKVGRSGQKQALVAWRDPNPFTIKEYGIKTGPKIRALWKLDDRDKIIGTLGVKAYRFFPRSHSARPLNFKVRARRDVRIALIEKYGEFEPIIEIFIGHDQNRKTTIQRFERVFFLRANSTEERSLLSPHSADQIYDWWYLNWTENNIMVGKQSEATPIAYWLNLEHPFKVTHYGLASGPKLECIWKIEGLKKRVKTNTTLYKYFPADNTTLFFKTITASDIRLALTSAAKETDPMYEIWIGDKNNSRTVIKFVVSQEVLGPIVETKNIISPQHARGFWVDWSRNHLLVGKDGETKPFMRTNVGVPFNFSYFGISSTYRAMWTFQGLDFSSLCFIREWRSRVEHTWIEQRGCYNVTYQQEKDIIPFNLSMPIDSLTCVNRRLKYGEYKLCLCSGDFCNGRASGLWCQLKTSVVLIATLYWIAYS